MCICIYCQIQISGQLSEIRFDYLMWQKLRKKKEKEKEKFGKGREGKSGGRVFNNKFLNIRERETFIIYGGRVGGGTYWEHVYL